MLIMKNIKILSILVMMLVFTSSCKKYVEGYDVDPNALTATNDQQAMQGVLLSMQFFQHSDGLRMAMIMMNQATGTDRQYTSFNNWNNINNSQFDSPWDEVYTTLFESRILEEEADKVYNIQLRGLAKLYRAWAGGEAASLWGDVPFSEAGLEDYPNPHYDNQSDVFAAVQDLLDEAIADLNSADGQIYADKDIYFGGDTTKWIKVANGLKARFYLNMKDYANASTYAALGPASAADDLIAEYGTYGNGDPYSSWNPMFQFSVWNRDSYIGETGCYASQLLQDRDNNDPDFTETSRLYYNYIPDWGIINAYKASWFGGGDNGKFYGNQPLLTYGEMLLIQAEADARTNGVANGVNKLNDYYNLLNAGYAPQGGNMGWGAGYPNRTPADYATLKDFLTDVLQERYLYFIGDLEAFVDHARVHGDPDVDSNYMQLKSGFTGNPLRFIYSQVEIDSNDNFPSTAPDINTPLPMYN